MQEEAIVVLNSFSRQITCTVLLDFLERRQWCLFYLWRWSQWWLPPRFPIRITTTIIILIIIEAMATAATPCLDMAGTDMADTDMDIATTFTITTATGAKRARCPDRITFKFECATKFQANKSHLCHPAQISLALSIYESWTVRRKRIMARHERNRQSRLTSVRIMKRSRQVRSKNPAMIAINAKLCAI